MGLGGFTYHRAESLEQATRWLAEWGAEAAVMAGGTDLLIKMRRGDLKPKAVIDIRRIPGLDRITCGPKTGLRIGATALLADVAAHRRVRKQYPAVAYAAQDTANNQIRNMGTLVGNLCNAAPSADNAPTLLAMGAGLTLASVQGARHLPLEDFFMGPGKTAIRPEEIVTEVCAPALRRGSGISYQHISPRSRVDISAAGVGVCLHLEGSMCRGVRIFMGAVGPVPLRAREAERILQGRRLSARRMEEAGRRAAREAQPITDLRATAEYRREMIAVLTCRALAEAAERARAKS